MEKRFNSKRECAELIASREYECKGLLCDECHFLMNDDDCELYDYCYGQGSLQKKAIAWLAEDNLENPPEATIKESLTVDDSAEFAKKLADDHWSYTESLLKVHGVDKAEVERIGFHVKSGMIHGFKHGVEYINEKQNEGK